MYKTRKEALESAKRILKKGTIYPMKTAIVTYGRGKNKTYNFRFVRKKDKLFR